MHTTNHDPIKTTDGRFEYITRISHAYTSEAAGSDYDKDLNAEGWARVWADHTPSGNFIVYRRERK